MGQFKVFDDPNLNRENCFAVIVIKNEMLFLMFSHIKND